METKKNIKDLNIDLKSLYDNKYQINIHLSDKPFIFHVLLMNIRGYVDCRISSFSANLWTRTKAGIEYRKYTRIQDLQTAIKKEIFRKIETNGEITFSLSKNIEYM